VTEAIDRLGLYALALLAFFRDVSVLVYGALKAPLLVRTRGARVVWEILVAQIRFTGPQGVVLCAFVALAIGALILIESIEFIPATDALPHIVAHVTVKDVAPVLTALVIIGRSGTAIAVELANMKLNGEIDALVAFGLPLEHVIVLPRLVAAVVAFLGMVIVAQAAALCGGYLIAAAVVRPPFGLVALVEAIGAHDLGVSLAKAVVLGVLISAICIREGLSVQVSQREVPQAATRAVVRSMTVCLVLNSFVSIYA
jgi:phospholipid/cholesterol/gamma-HCH transport system permease protein